MHDLNCTLVLLTAICCGYGRDVSSGRIPGYLLSAFRKCSMSKKSFFFSSRFRVRLPCSTVNEKHFYGVVNMIFSIKPFVVPKDLTAGVIVRSSNRSTDLYLEIWFSFYMTIVLSTCSGVDQLPNLCVHHTAISTLQTPIPRNLPDKYLIFWLQRRRGTNSGLDEQMTKFPRFKIRTLTVIGRLVPNFPSILTETVFRQLHFRKLWSNL